MDNEKINNNSHYNDGHEHHDNTSDNKQVVSVKKGMEKYISKIPRNIKIQQVQKCVLLGTAQINHRTLSSRGGLGIIN